MRTWEARRPFLDVLREDADVVGALGDERLAACFDLDRALAQRRPHVRRPGRVAAPVAARTGAVSKLSLPHHYTRQGPRPLRGRPRPHAGRRLRPRSRCSTSCCPTRSRQGPGAHRAVDVLVRADRATCVPNHLVSSDPTDFPETAGPDVAGRAMLVQAAQPVRLECVARGYLFGSAWSEYQETGHGVRPHAAGRAAPGRAAARSRSSRPPPRPTSGHDLPLTDAEAAELVGAERFEQLRDAHARGLPRSAPRTPPSAG